MQLTLAQLQSLKANIAASPDMIALNAEPHDADKAAQIAAAYNAPAAVDFWIWRTSVTKDELTNSISVDATTFSWTGAGYITRAQGERDAFRDMFDVNGTVNPSRTNVRQAFNDIFSGTGVAATNRTHLLTVCRRKATRLERLYATGTGSTATPGLLVVEGDASAADVLNAWNS